MKSSDLISEMNWMKITAFAVGEPRRRKQAGGSIGYPGAPCELGPTRMNDSRPGARASRAPFPRSPSRGNLRAQYLVGGSVTVAEDPRLSVTVRLHQRMMPQGSGTGALMAR
jgi:hypothetical protein